MREGGHRTTLVPNLMSAPLATVQSGSLADVFARAWPPSPPPPPTFQNRWSLSYAHLASTVSTQDCTSPAAHSVDAGQSPSGARCGARPDSSCCVHAAAGTLAEQARMM